MSTVVVKLGGSSLQNSDTLTKLAVLIKELRNEGHKPVVIHGGGPAINQELTRRGVSWQFINGQRQTTPEMISVIEDVLATQINSSLTQSLQAENIPALGISGANNILICTQASLELQQVGNIEQVNIENIQALLNLENSQVPVIAPIGIGFEGKKYNINADWAAAKIAVALNAKKIIFLTDQNGILDKKNELVEMATPELIHEMINAGVIHGGMYTKVMTMMMALEKGVGEVLVLHASQAHEYGRKTQGTRLIENNSPANNKEIPKWNHEQKLEMILN